MDLHLAGDLRGSPPAKWLVDRNLGICRGCHRSASLRFHGGVHSRCWRRLQGQDLVEARLGLAGDERIPLPSIEEIFCIHISTKESLPSSLMALAREEYGKCLARILESSYDHAWDIRVGILLRSSNTGMPGKNSSYFPSVLADNLLGVNVRCSP